MSSASPAETRLLFGPIRFHGPQSKSRSIGASRFVALYMIGLGVWAVAAGWPRQPVLAVLAGLIYVEVALSGLRVSMLVGDVVYDESQARRIARSLFELCDRAGCQPPTVVVRNDRLRGAAVRVWQGEIQLLLSALLVDRLTDRQLRAIIAHEVAHLAAGDLPRVRRRVVAGFAAGLAGAVLPGVAIGFRAGYWPLYGAGFLWVLLLVRLPLSLLNRPLELRADAEGATLAADPCAEAEALTIAHAIAIETRGELTSSYWRYLLFLSPLRWRLPTHPPITERVGRLARVDIGAENMPTLGQSPNPPSEPEPVGHWPPGTIPPSDTSASEFPSDQQALNGEWTTRPGQPVGSNRGPKLSLLLIGIVAIVLIFLATGSHRNAGSPSTVGMSSEAQCPPAQPGIAMSLSASVSGGKLPYHVEWTLNGRPDTTDPVSVVATTVSGAIGQQYTITIIPTSANDSMIATITDANPLDSAEQLRVMGPTAACSTPLPPTGG